MFGWQWLWPWSKPADAWQRYGVFYREGGELKFFAAYDTPQHAEAVAYRAMREANDNPHWVIDFTKPNLPVSASTKRIARKIIRGDLSFLDQP